MAMVLLSEVYGSYHIRVWTESYWKAPLTYTGGSDIDKPAEGSLDHTNRELKPTRS